MPTTISSRVWWAWARRASVAQASGDGPRDVPGAPGRDVEHLAELLAGGRLVRERRERLVKAGEPAAVGPDGEDEHLDQRRLPTVGEHPAAEAQSFRVVDVGEGASDAGAAEGRLVRGAVRERRSSDAGGGSCVADGPAAPRGHCCP